MKMLSCHINYNVRLSYICHWNPYTWKDLLYTKTGSKKFIWQQDEHMLLWWPSTSIWYVAFYIPCYDYLLFAFYLSYCNCYCYCMYYVLQYVCWKQRSETDTADSIYWVTFLNWNSNVTIILKKFWSLAVLQVVKLANLDGIVKSCIFSTYQTHEIYQVRTYSMDFKAPGELWNPWSKTVVSKCTFIWNKGPVNIWSYRKAQK